MSLLFLSFKNKIPAFTIRMYNFLLFLRKSRWDRLFDWKNFLFSLQRASKASLYRSVDPALPLPYATAENDSVCNQWSKLNKTIYALTIRDTEFLS